MCDLIGQKPMVYYTGKPKIKKNQKIKQKIIWF